MEAFFSFAYIVFLIVIFLINASVLINFLVRVVRKITRPKENEPEIITIKDDLLPETPEDQWPEIPEEQW